MAPWSAIPTSWVIASAEYACRVPADRIGPQVASLTRPPVGRECITPAVFPVYAGIASREVPRWNTADRQLIVEGFPPAHRRGFWRADRQSVSVLIGGRIAALGAPAGLRDAPPVNDLRG